MSGGREVACPSLAVDGTCADRSHVSHTLAGYPVLYPAGHPGYVAPFPLPKLADLDGVDVIQVYPAEDGWRWRYCCASVDEVAILADSGQGYSRRIDAIAGVARVVGLEAELLEAKPTTSIGRGYVATRVRLQVLVA